jgi:hypothetical protein
MNSSIRLTIAAGVAVLVVGTGASVAGAAGVTDSRVSVGTPSGVTPQNHQNEPAVAIDAHNPDFLVAGANDHGDQQPCLRTLAVDQGTCEIDNGVGVSGVYFSFDRGRHWMQPTYTGLTARDCGSDSPCDPHLGPTGRIPWYYESGLVDAGDPAVAVGPKPVNGTFSWANGSRVYYSNNTADLSDYYGVGADGFRGFSATAVSRLDDPTPTRVAQKSSWMAPVIVSKQNSAVFNDKDQIWADNAESSRYFGRVYACSNAFRSNGQHSGTNSVPLPLYVSTSTDGGSTWKPQQLSSADSTGQGPNDWGIAACSIRTDSHGTVYVFAEATGNRAIAGPPSAHGVPVAPSNQDTHVMWKSTDGGATWSRMQTLFSVTDTCEFVDVLSERCIMDGQAGARSDIASAPAVDIANGAPTGADATDLIVDAWTDSRLGVNHEKALVSSSGDGGHAWSAPTAVSMPGDRPIYAAPAISPNGDRAYVVYEAVTSPWAASDLTSPRPYHGVFATAPATAAGTGPWSTLYNGPFGDLRATFPGHRLEQERIGDYIYAAASRSYGVGVYIDARNAAECPAVQDWRARSLAAGQPVLPGPWPLAACPAGFGNTDVWTATTG